MDNVNQIRENWDLIKETLREEYDLSDISYNTWVKPLNFNNVKDGVVTIMIPSDQAHALKYISNKYKSYFQVTISEMMDETYDISFILEKDAEDEMLSAPGNVYNINYENANLNSKYRFDTFVVGNNNKFAHSASLAVAESPGVAYNPLYLYGGAGLGKTHLMHSIGHFILDQNPDMKVLYVTSEQFTNEVIESIRSGNAAKMTKLRDKYRTVDVLLIDDVQFIIGKESTQEEFFHTFNELHSAGKQIILSSDKPPKEMETLEERFRSRFEWGLIADIQPPDYETRMAILKKNAESYNKEISEEIIKSKAKKIYVCNIMTQPGETDNYTVSDHLKALIQHAGSNKIVDAVLVNDYLPDNLAGKYQEAGSYPVKLDIPEVKKLGIKIFAKKLIQDSREGLVRHSSTRVARAVYYWFKKQQKKSSGFFK